MSRDVNRNVPQAFDEEPSIVLIHACSPYHLSIFWFKAFTAACRDHAVRCIVLRANGQHFSSGHDLGSDSHMLDLTARGYAPGPRGDLEKWNETGACVHVKYSLRAYVRDVRGALPHTLAMNAGRTFIPLRAYVPRRSSATHPDNECWAHVHY